VASSSYNTKVQQDGGAVFNEQGANVDHRIEGDTDPNLFVADASADAVGFGTNAPGAKVDVVQLTLGNPVAGFRSTTRPGRYLRQNSVNTTNATVTTLHSYTTTSDRAIFIRAEVLARRTGGSAGTNGDCAAYVIEGVYKNVGGTVTLVGALSVTANESQAGWDATLDISTTAIRVRVTGATNNNITWDVDFWVKELGS